MARHIRHYPLQSYNFKPRRQILTVRSYIQIHLTPPPLFGRCACVRTLAGCAAFRHRPRFGQHGLYAQSQHDSKHHRAGWSGLGGPPGRDQGQGGPRPAQRGGDGRRGRPGRRRTPGSASRPLLKIASVSDLMRFVMIVGDSRRRNFELSGLKVRPGARAARGAVRAAWSARARATARGHPAARGPGAGRTRGGMYTNLKAFP